MAKNKNDLGKEFKALGGELAEALKQIRSSKEFNDLEKEIASSFKTISSSLGKSLKAASQSKSTAKIKSRLKRVAKSGAVQGTEEARKLRAVTLKGMRRILAGMKNLSKRIES